MLAPIPYWPWIKAAVFVLTCFACYLYGGSTAKDRAQLACMKAQQAAGVKAQARADALNDKLREALKRPSVATEVERVVIENPSGCKLPDAVAKRLQDGIADANRAAE